MMIGATSVFPLSRGQRLEEADSISKLAEKADAIGYDLAAAGCHLPSLCESPVP